MTDVADLRAQLQLFYRQFDKALKHIESGSKKTGKIIEKNLSSKAPAKAFKKTKEAVDQTTKAVKKTTQATSNWVWTATSGIKAVSRVVYGILIAQTFYRLINAIQEAGRSMWQFQISMEQAYLALELLLDSVAGAEIMLRRLETFAALTPFQMGDVITGTRRLMGFGFTAQEVLPILEALADATAIIGVSPQQLDDLTRALGKIRATGRMTAREIRSFGAAGIPVFQILQEELGLTRDQIRNIGREAAGQANIVIPAILRGLEARFGGAAERLARTVGGLLSTIQDDLLLIAKDITAGLYDIYRGFLGRLVDRLEELRDILVEKGVGGFFEALVPPKYHQLIRTMVAGLQSIGRALLEVWRALQPIRAAFIDFFIHTLAVIIPILNTVITAIARFFTWALQGAPIIRRLTIATFGAVAAFQSMLIIIAVTNALKKLMKFIGLTAALTHKWLLIIAVIIGALTYWALSIKKVRDWLDRLFNSLGRFLGLDTTNILRPLEALDEALPDETDWHQVREGTLAAAEGIEEVGKEAEKTKKKLDKFLLAFDEVYAIPEKVAAVVKMPEIEALKLPDFMEEFPVEQYYGKMEDVAETALGEVEDLWGNLWDKILVFFKNLWQHIKEIFRAWLQLIKDVWNAFKQLFIDIWHAIKQLAIDVWNSIKQLFIDLWTGLATFIKDIWKAITDFAKGLWGAIKQLFKDLWSAETFKDVINAFKTFFITVWDLMVKLVNDISTAFFKWVGSVIEAFSTFFDNIKAAWNTFFNNLSKAYARFFNSMKEAYNKFFQRWRESWNKFYSNTFGTAAAWLNKFVTLFITKFGTIYLLIVDKVASIYNAIVSKFQAIYNKIIDIARAIVSTIKNMVNSIINLINKIPKINIPLINEETSIGVDAGVRGMQHGGILNKEQIVRAAEGGTREVFTPLTADALKPWAQAIATALGGTRQGTDSMQEISYVAVPIDQKGMIDLERKLFVLRRRENIRRSVGVTV